MNKLIILIIFLAWKINSSQENSLPNLVPNIIVETAAAHVHQNMSQSEKIKCLLVKDYLALQTRLYLISNQELRNAIEQFTFSASDYNCQKILNLLHKMLYGRSENLPLNSSIINYNHIKFILFNAHNSLEDKAYFESAINILPEKSQTPNLSSTVLSTRYQPLPLQITQKKDILINETLSDIITKKIADALTPSSMDDLKQLENIYKLALKKAANWFCILKNLVK